MRAAVDRHIQGAVMAQLIPPLQNSIHTRAGWKTGPSQIAKNDRSDYIDDGTITLVCHQNILSPINVYKRTGDQPISRYHANACEPALKLQDRYSLNSHLQFC